MVIKVGEVGNIPQDKLIDPFAKYKDDEKVPYPLAKEINKVMEAFRHAGMDFNYSHHKVYMLWIPPFLASKFYPGYDGNGTYVWCARLNGQKDSGFFIGVEYPSPVSLPRNTNDADIKWIGEYCIQPYWDSYDNPAKFNV